MGTGGHNVPLVVCGEVDNGDLLIRKLTPEECLAFQGFHKDYISQLKNVPISNMKKYQQVGNSVPVTVVEKIAKLLIPLLEIK